MSNNTIACPICYEQFDADEHIPKISPCGHTTCEKCLVQVLKMPEPKCPLDKKVFGRKFQTIDDFATNFLLKDLLEMRGKWSRCPTHGKENEMICLTDNQLICGACAISETHKEHKIKMLSDFEDIIQEKKNQLSAVSSKISNVSSEVAKSLEEKKEDLKNAIKDRFQIFRLEITRQEISMLMEAESMFKDEKSKLNTMASSKLDLPFDIQAKSKEFAKIMSNPNFMKLIEEDFSNLEKNFEEKLGPFKEKSTEEISELLAVFQNNLPKDLNIIGPFNQDLNQLLEKRDVSQAIEIKEITLPPVKLEITQVEKNGSWTLNIQDSESEKPWTFLKTDLERINKINYDSKWNKDVTYEADLYTIKFLSKFLKNLKTVRLSIDGDPAYSAFETLSEARFSHLISAIFSQLDEKIEEIDICISSASIRDCGIRNLAETVLPRLKNLKIFAFLLRDTQTTSKALTALNKVDFSKYSDLQKFNVSIKRCPLDEECILEFLNRVPNVSDLLLCFVGSSLTDKALDSFSTNILPSLNKTQTLRVEFYNTGITDEGVYKLLNGIPSVKNLTLDFYDTKITDAGVQEFVTTKLPTLTSLKGFDLFLGRTGVSARLRDQVEEWKEKIEGVEEHGRASIPRSEMARYYYRNGNFSSN